MNVRMETQNDYEERCKDDGDLMRKYWAKTVPGYSGEVGQTARKAQTEKPFDLRHMLKRIEEEFGTLSEKATAKAVRKFIADTLRNLVKILRPSIVSLLTKLRRWMQVTCRCLNHFW